MRPWCAISVLAVGIAGALATAASAAIYANERYGFTVGYSSSDLTPQPEPDAHDGLTFRSRDDSRVKVLVYGGYRTAGDPPEGGGANCAKDQDAYRVSKPGLFALSCVTLQGDVFYQKTLFHGDRQATILATYPVGAKPRWDGIIRAMAKSLALVNAPSGGPTRSPGQ